MQCTDTDLEYYIKECGLVAGVSPLLESSKRSAKHILERTLRALIAFKSIERDDVLAPVMGYQLDSGSYRGSNFTHNAPAPGVTLPTAPTSTLPPGAVPLRHGVGAAGLGPGVAAGFHA
jgi:hypothetical protein